jgi:tetratricopeptide (TPR) repeat protein
MTSQAIAALLEQAIDRHQAGEIAAAIPLYQTFLRHVPTHSHALHLLGVAYAQQGDSSTALDLIRQAIAGNNRVAAFHGNLASVLLTAGRPAEALAAASQALTLAPTLVDAHLAQGNALAALGRFEEAEVCLHAALALRPDSPEIRVALAEVLNNRQRPEEAEPLVRTVLTVRPKMIPAFLALATSLARQRRLTEAKTLLEQARDLAPSHPDILCNLGLIHTREGHFATAAACHRAALAIRSEHPQALAGLGNALAGLGEISTACTYFDLGLARHPHDSGLRWNRSLARLAAGEWVAGWEDFDARLDDPTFRNRPEIWNRPLWQGTVRDGTTLLVHAEQGLGDTLQFVRFIPFLPKELRVVLEVQPSLCSLLQALPGPVQILARGESLPPFDCHCPLLSLPRWLGVTLETLPTFFHPLSADSCAAAQWLSRLVALAGSALRVGLIWAGNPGVWDDSLRSPRLPALLPLLQFPGIHVFGLQAGDGRRDLELPEIRATLAELPFTDLGADLTDFATTAAIMEGCDLIISSCTASAHLAGSLGRPLWILLGSAPDWRWLRNREDSPWYPSARLFRHPPAEICSPKEWSPVIQQILQELTRLVKNFNTTSNRATL